MTVEMKRLVLKHMEEAGTFDYTRAVLRDLYMKLNACIEGLEQQAGDRNWILRLLLQRLEI
jgi:ophiobolin F synthase